MRCALVHSLVPASINVFVQSTESIPLALSSSLRCTDAINNGCCQHDGLDTSNQLTNRWIHVRCSAMDALQYVRLNCTLRIVLENSLLIRLSMASTCVKFIFLWSHYCPLRSHGRAGKARGSTRSLCQVACIAMAACSKCRPIKTPAGRRGL
jgi:hypothetical protein